MDSIEVNPHKWLYAPLDAGCVLVADQKIFALRLPVVLPTITSATALEYSGRSAAMPSLNATLGKIRYASSGILQETGLLRNLVQVCYIGASHGTASAK